MRSAEQLKRTPREWIDHQALERARILRELLALLERARLERAPWYVWILEGRPPLTAAEYDRQRALEGKATRRGRR